jgi:hypothetical protein
LHVRDQSLERVASIEPQSALSLVCVSANDHESASGSVLLNDLGLIFGGVLLMFRGHADVLRSTPSRRRHSDALFKAWVQFCDQAILPSAVKALPALGR